MPREMSLTSGRPLDLPTLVEAGASIDGTLAPRTLFGGWAIQLVDASDVAVLTVELSRRLEDGWDLERLTGFPAPPHAELWFTEATAPWGPAGEPGVEVVRRLGELMDARVIVEEGR